MQRHHIIIMKITLPSLKCPRIDAGPVKSFFSEYGSSIWSCALDFIILCALIAGAVFSFKILSPVIGVIVILGTAWYLIQRIFWK